MTKVAAPSTRLINSDTMSTASPTLKTKLLAAALLRGARVLKEQQEQAPMAAPPVTTPATPDQTAQQQPPEAQPQAPATGPAIDQVIAKLNDIRAGKSFEDPNTYAKLSAVYNGMDEQAKAVLDKALGDVAMAVQPQPPPQAAPPQPPQQPPAPAATPQQQQQQQPAPAAAV